MEDLEKQRKKSLKAIMNILEHNEVHFEIKVKKKPKGVHVIYEVTQKDMDALVSGMKKRMEGKE